MDDDTHLVHLPAVDVVEAQHELLFDARRQVVTTAVSVNIVVAITVVVAAPVRVVAASTLFRRPVATLMLMLLTLLVLMLMLVAVIVHNTS